MDDTKEKFRFQNNDSALVTSVDSMTAAREKMNRHLAHMFNTQIQSLDITHDISQLISPAISNLVTEVHEQIFTMRPLFESLQQSVASLCDAISKWDIPALTEENKEKLTSSHRLWGQYGWTPLPSISFKLFYDPPANIDEANALMKKQCSKRKLESLFDEIRRGNVKKNDLEEAINCYNNRCYKACALILSGIIEAKLIRRQRRSTYRKVGSSAVDIFAKESESICDKESFLTILHLLNLISCLETFFQPGKNFKIEPATVNRNFISHGMARRSVRKRDCVQLFLLLYNLMIYLEVKP